MKVTLPPRVSASRNDELVSVFPPGLSFECCEGDQEAEHIEFTHVDKVNLSISNLNKSKVGTGWKTLPIPLYHAHVLWSVVHCTTLLEDGTFQLRLLDVGSRLRSDRLEEIVTKVNVDRLQNHPKGLLPPKVLGATVTFIDRQGNAKAAYEYFSIEDYMVARPFTRKELYAFADGDRIHIRICIIVARSYFSLEKLLRNPSTVSESTKDTVASILRGEKPDGCDWSITVASGDGDCDLPRTYHVHAANLARVSEKFKYMVKTGRSNSDIIKASGKRSCIIPALAPDDMPVLISIAYGIDAPLPTNIERFGMTGRTLTALLDQDHFFGVVFRQWEFAICQQALALDKRDFASFTVLVRLLTFIWSAPYGFLPAAKRVAIGVFADMVWLNLPPGEKDYIKFINTKVLPSLVGLPPIKYMQNIMASVNVHIEVVSAVRKVGLPTNKKTVVVEPKKVEMEQKKVEVEQKKVEVEQKKVEMEQKKVEVEQKRVEVEQKKIEQLIPVTKPLPSSDCIDQQIRNEIHLPSPSRDPSSPTVVSIEEEEVEDTVENRDHSKGQCIIS